MFNSNTTDQRGFSYPELLVVVVIIALVFFATIPLYKQFNTLNELKNTAQKLRDELRSAQNRAASGVTSANGSPAHWVVKINSSATTDQYETGACPVVTDTAATGYASRYIFDSCPNRSNNRVIPFPSQIFVSHQYSGASSVYVFFSSINGGVTVYDSIGVILGNTVDIRIDSEDYPDIYIILKINQSGTISEERHTN